MGFTCYGFPNRKAPDAPARLLDELSKPNAPRRHLSGPPRFRCARSIATRS
jgi:hypothetical protein